MRLGFARFQEVPFGGALLFSILWHLFWFSSIKIVSLPAKVQYPRFSAISFLGPLMDEPSFEVHVTASPFSRSQPMVPSGWIRKVPFQEFLKEETDLLKGIPGDFLRLQKRNPTVPLKEEGRIKEDVLLLKGPAASRLLYYRPPLPELPRWLDPRDVRSSLELRFWVSPRGKVVTIEKITSSGDPTLDLIGIRHLRRWQFNPKATDQEEAGIVTLHFPLSGTEPQP